jgi:hypothetical protein
MMDIGELKIGQRVKFGYQSGAASCQSSHYFEGEGEIVSFDEPDGNPFIQIKREGYSRDLMLFPREVKEVLG